MVVYLPLILVYVYYACSKCMFKVNDIVSILENITVAWCLL